MSVCGMLASPLAAEPVPLNTGWAEAQPNTFSADTSELRGSRPSFFSSTMPSSPVSCTTARELATTSSEISALEALSTPETMAYMGPKQTRLTTRTTASRPARAALQRTTWRVPFFTANWAAIMTAATAASMPRMAYT